MQKSKGHRGLRLQLEGSNAQRDMQPTLPPRPDAPGIDRTRLGGGGGCKSSTALTVAPKIMAHMLSCHPPCKSLFLAAPQAAQPHIHCRTTPQVAISQHQALQRVMRIARHSTARLTDNNRRCSAASSVGHKVQAELVCTQVHTESACALMPSARRALQASRTALTLATTTLRCVERLHTHDTNAYQHTCALSSHYMTTYMPTSPAGPAALRRIARTRASDAKACEADSHRRHDDVECTADR